MLQSRLKEIIWFDCGLLQDRPEGAFWQISSVIRYRRIALRFGIEPDFVATSCLTVKLESDGL